MQRVPSPTFGREVAPTPFLPLQSIVLPLLIGALILISLFAVARTWIKTADDNGGWDLQPYWYFGHFVRAGINPYVAYAEDFVLPDTLTYADGTVARPDAAEVPQLGRVPANTAPILLFFTLFSFLPWTAAKVLWFLCNLLLIAAIPWLLMRLLPLNFQLPSQLQWLAALSFYATKGPREATASGQTTLLVFALMAVTLLLRQRYWLWAGIALGLAMGKYSLALPICLFLLLERRFRVLAVAALVQVLALSVMASLDNGSLYSSFWESAVATLKVNWAMVARHSVLPGIHFSYMLRAFPVLVNVSIIVVTVCTFAAVGYSRLRGWDALDVLPVNSALVLWMTLVVYHRNYDSLVVVIFFILCLSVIATWQLPPKQIMAFGIFYLLLLGVFCLPGDILRTLLPDSQVDMFMLSLDRAITIAIVCMLATNLWLLLRTPRLTSSA